MRRALAEVHGLHHVDAPHVRVAGRTDGAIARDILLAAGVPVERIDALAAEVRAACCRAFEELCPADLSDKLAPGIAAALETLSGSGAYRFSLVTGNFEPVARLKLARAGIGRYFPPGQGAFGSDAEDRIVLPPLARGRAGEWPRSRTVVIGDTPLDVDCAHADGLVCIAVTTGPYPEESLGGADHLAHSADELLAALDALV